MSIASPSPLTIERAALYELVWQEPMTKIAPRFGLSDVGLAKACKRYNIPRPPVGYWAQKAVGKAPRRTPLPPVKEGDAKPITFSQDEKPKPVAIKSHSERVTDEQLKSLIAFEERPENKINVVQNPSKLHPFVEGTKSWLIESAKPYDILGHRSTYDGPRLRIEVSKTQQHRALILFDALIKSALKRGHEVVFERSRNQYERDMVLFIVLGERYWFRIREKQKMIRIPESEQNARGGNRVEYQHSGVLELQLWRKQNNSNEMGWIDGKTHRIEDDLNSVIMEMLVCVEKDRDWRRIQEERKAESHTAEMRRWQQQAERQKQEKKITELLEVVQRWDNSSRIREFVAAVYASNQQQSTTIETGSDLDLWLKWALTYADSVDPTPTAEIGFLLPLHGPIPDLRVSDLGRELICDELTIN